MKRHITDYESKLLKDGWKLLYKTYKGKDSQFVWTYVYAKAHKGHLFKLALDKKRETTLGIFIETPHTEFLSIDQLKDISESYLELSNHIHELEFGVPLDDEEEIVEVVESVENE